MAVQKIFFTALPGILAQLNKYDSAADKLEYLYWMKKEMKNMVAEFKRIDAEWMLRISQEGFSSREVHLDSFIRLGTRVLKKENKYNKNNLYEFVEKEIKVREETVLPQIDNEIEYYERIARRADNQSNKEKNNVQMFSTFDFDYRKIRVEIDELPTQGKKKAYLLFLQKELKRVIRCYESDRFTPWKVKGENCSERNRFIEERYDVYNRVYNREEHNIDQYVEADVRKKTEELKDLAKAIDDEIDFVNAMSTIREERNMDDFKILWEELTEGNFDLKVLLRQFEQIGEDREDEYIEYCVRRFRHRTIDEWMRYYATKNLTENIEALKKARLPEELEYKNTIRITNAKFEDSTLGQWTRDNLESFEKKYIDAYSKKYSELSELNNERPFIINGVKKTEINKNKKEKWNGTKTEFARKVAEEYQADKGKKYKSLKNASEQIFQKYEFDDKNFTKERCYDLVRKV